LIIMYDRIIQFCELTPWITIAYSRLPGWASFGFPFLLEFVTTIDAMIWPIMKPVSSKL
jgi:hypothetical protein